MNRCPKCDKGRLIQQPIAVVCNHCAFASTLGDQPDDIGARVLDTLRSAQQCLGAVNFDPAASHRGDQNGLPETLGRVRSRVNRAVGLLEGGTA